MLNRTIYANLLVQFDKVFKHNRQGSYRTKQRYAEAFKRLLVFICATKWYKGYIEEGESEFQARKKVAKLLGHGRDDVTRVYLASLCEDSDIDGC